MITKIVLSVLSLALLLATAQAVNLSASPSRFRDAFTDVTVTWSDLSRAGYFDIIEVYDAAQPDYTFTYKRTYGKKSGEVTFNLVNSRSNYGIRYISRAIFGAEEQLNQNSAILNQNQPFPGNTEGSKEQWPATGLNLDAGAVWTLESEENKETQSSAPLTLAKIGKELTSIIVEVDGTYPQQIHLSLTHEHSSMRVMWVSSTRGTVVKYGTQSGQYSNSVTGNFHTYTSDDMKQHRILPISTSFFIDPGFIHDAVMTNLLPNTRYYYVVGDGEHDFSQERSFVTAPAPESIVKQSNGQVSFPEVNIFAFGDSGTSECEDMKGFCEKESSKTYNNILTDMRAKKYDFLLHFGDIAYATGFAKRWDQFFSQIEPISSAIPYMVSVGNHDYDCFSQPYRPLWANYLEDSGGECGVPYANRFHMPGVRSKQNLMAPLSQDVNKNDNLWYSFDYSGVHVIAISLEHDFTAGSEQYQWLENDLANVDRSRTPFVILMGHRPMYCSALTPTNYLFNKMMQHHLEDLLYKYHVDLALWGHLHVYERSCPVYKTHCVEDGIVHVVAGSAGFTLNPAFFPAPKWSAYRELTHGYTRINVNPQRIRVEYVRNDEHHVVDYVEIPVKKYLIH